jgi:hypothetical protein
MHQQRLAGDHVEGIGGQGDLGGVALDECDELRRRLGRYSLKQLPAFLEPLRFTIHAGESGGWFQVAIEQPRPMTSAATNVRQRRSFVQAPACCHQIEEIAIPPEVALRTKLISGMFQTNSKIKIPKGSAKAARTLPRVHRSPSRKLIEFERFSSNLDSPAISHSR